MGTKVNWSNAEIEISFFEACEKYPPFAEQIGMSAFCVAATMQSELGLEVDPAEVERHMREMWDLDTLSTECEFIRKEEFSLPAHFSVTDAS